MGPPDGLLDLLGRLHVLLVHFPVGLVLAALLSELLLTVRPSWSLEDAGQFCLIVGAVAAVVAAGLGWLRAEVLPVAEGEHQLLAIHRWLGLGAAGLTVLAAAVSRQSGRAGTRSGLRLSLLAAASVTAVASWYGALLVHGAEHFG